MSSTCMCVRMCRVLGVGVAKVNGLTARVSDWLKTWPGNRFWYSIPGLIYANSLFHFPPTPRPEWVCILVDFPNWWHCISWKCLLSFPVPGPWPYLDPTLGSCMPFLLLSGLCFSLYSQSLILTHSPFCSLSLSLSLCRHQVPFAVEQPVPGP